MINWLFRVFVLIACPLLTYFQISKDQTGILIGLGVGVVLIIVAFAVEAVSLLTIVSGVLGASAGMILSKLVDYAVFQMGNNEFYILWAKYSVLRYFAFAVFGMFVTVKKLLPELDTLDRDILSLAKRRGAEMKVVDTSAIIDGRIVDICETRFLSGQLIVPRFILNELQGLADSEDNVTRARGRRGLDMLARLQENPEIPVKIIDKDVPEEDQVDGKVVRLAKQLGGKVFTTDFNLNKVAAVEGVACLNVNDLTTALKPVVLPGERMSLFVMKEGKERKQGVGYLDDGTMVVVEDGQEYIGKRVDAQVTSILQTSAGRMLFTKFKGATEE
jgi:uncharacterized protein YacL